MDRTTVKTQEKKKSPVKLYITFSGETGKFKYYDGENKELDSVTFALVKVMSSITGWSDDHNAKIYSNLVSSTVKEELVVRAGKEELVRGHYADIKADIANSGGSFTTNLFALASVNDNWVPVNLQFKGTALAAWSDFCKVEGIFNLLGKKLVSAGQGEKKKKGKVEYYEPAFTSGDLPEAIAELADRFTTEELKPYLEKG